MARKAKAKKSKTTRRSKPSKPSEPSALALWWGRCGARYTIRLLAVAVVIGAGLWGLIRLERHLLASREAQPAVRVALTLDEPPDWMPDSLAHEIARELTAEDDDFRDTDLPRRIYDRAVGHPWIREIQFVRRTGRNDDNVGQMQLVASYRRPIARVIDPTDGYARFVDAEGYVLPPRQVPQWVVNVPARDGRPARQMCYLSRGEVPADRRAGPIHYIAIRGVGAPSPGIGRSWVGRDLREGLRLVQLLQNRSYVNQITVVDVHDTSMLKMYAQFRRGRRTYLEFGRFPHPQADYVVPTDRKLAYLDGYVADHDGRLAGADAGLELYGDELVVIPFQR